jgi:hypothetical protein
MLFLFFVSFSAAYVFSCFLLGLLMRFSFKKPSTMEDNEIDVVGKVRIVVSSVLWVA